MSYYNKGTTGPVAIVTSEKGGGNFTFVAGTDDPAVAIENAWDYLDTLGGGTLVTKGPGETWTIESTINSQGDDVVWMSDWSLLIQAEDDLDSDVVNISHSRVTLYGLYLDGNGVNQTDDEHSCVEMSGTYEKNRILYCRIENATRKNIRCIATGTELEVAYNHVSLGRWNNLNFNTVTDSWIHHNYFYYTSDVHVSLYASDRVKVENNIMERTGLGVGATDSNWGVGLETVCNDIDIYNNLFIDIDHHAVDVSYNSHLCTNINIYNNDFIDCGTVTGGQATSIHCGNTDGLEVVNNRFRNCSIDADGTIRIRGEDFPCTDWRVMGNKILMEDGTGPFSGSMFFIDITADDGEIVDNKITCLETGGNQQGIRLDGVDDILVEGNIVKVMEDYCIYVFGTCNDIHIEGGQLEGTATGVYAEDVTDITVKNVVFKPDIGTAVDFNRASVANPVVMGCYAKGVTSDYSVAGASGELLRDNIALGGGWFADT